MDPIVVTTAAVLVMGLVCAWIFRRRVDCTIQTPQVPSQSPLNPILTMSATQLSKKLRARELTSVGIVESFIAHIRAVNPYLNAIVFQRFDEALEEAQMADALLARILDARSRGEVVPVWDPTEEESRRLNIPYVAQSIKYNHMSLFPPKDYPSAASRGDEEESTSRKSKGVLVDPGWLLGVPCTVKECMQVVGCPHSSGTPIRQQMTPTLDSPIVANLRRCGAVVLGVTNTSELCMWLESHNQVYGICRNPYDTRCIVGGSSGGEGAAVGAMLAPFGVGSDIGGSIRMPAFFNGIFGHKASTRLVCNFGQYPGVENSANFLLSTGPMCHHAEDLYPLLHIMIRGGPLLDAKLYKYCPKPPASLYLREKEGAQTTFRVGAKRERLQVYCIEDLGLFNVYPSPSNMTVVRECGERLARELDAEVTYINFRDKSRCYGAKPIPKGWDQMFYTMDIWAALMSDTEKTFTQLMSFGCARSLNAFWHLLRWFFRCSDHTLPAILLMLYEGLILFTPNFMARSHRAKARQLQKDVEVALGDTGVIIMPTYPHPAPQHHQPTNFPFNFQYTSLFNALQLPATAVPIWSSAIAPSEKAPDPLDTRPGRPLERIAPSERCDVHLPRGVQVVSSWGEDVLSISVAVELERMLGGYKVPSWA